MKQFTKTQAIALHDSGIWEDMTDEDIVKLQLYQEKLCVPWSVFRDSINNVLGRGVYTHEFAFPELLIEEYEGKRAKPTIDEIINLIPSSKRVLITH